jgi:hypothetical protein
MKKQQSERCLTSRNGETENEWSYNFIPTDILYVMFSVQEYFSHAENIITKLLEKIIYFNITLILYDVRIVRSIEIN